MSTFTVFGATFDSELFFCRHVVNRIVHLDEQNNLEFESLLEIDYLNRLEELKLQKGGGFYRHQSNHCVLRDGNYVGELMALIEIAIKDYGIEDVEIANNNIFESAAREATIAALKAIPNPTVFLEFGRDSSVNDPLVLGTVIIELFDDLCPKACENFRYLCTGEMGRVPNSDVSLFYEGCPVHRLVKGGWLQSGDIVDGSGSRSVSAFGGFFEDESFSVGFGNKIGGIVGYSNKGTHTNGSQFFITLGPCEWMNFSKVGFGRVVQGYTVLKKLDKAPVTNERPNPEIIIKSCGRYEDLTI